jgi:phosphoglucomutase/phosphomannomutase
MNPQDSSPKNRISALSPQEIEICKRILDWASPPFPLEIRDEAAHIYIDFIESNHTEEVDFYSRELEFGTGGMRGVIGNGAGRMNRWTVGRVSLAFAEVIREDYANPSIVIAYDSRMMSDVFAKTAAGISAKLGIRVYLFETVAPTPILSFAIRHLGASGGIVITASHNPPEYNGFKAYLDDGSQLVGDAQKKVERHLAEITDWSMIEFLDESEPMYTKQVTRIGEEIRTAYYTELKKQFFVSAPANPKKSKLKIVYSPLHGTGGPWVQPLLSHFGFTVHPVEEQERPDGAFPTVVYPNPEEEEAMRLSEQKAKSIEADIFIATDPDADRMGAGVRRPDGSYLLLNGNQIGSIMCAYLCEKLKEGGNPKYDYHVIKTIVTTDLQKEIAKQNGVNILDVLTGFKYIAERMRNIEEGTHGYQKGRDQFLFGGEESYGYLPVDFVRDKDSLSSTLLLCEILVEKRDLLSYLNQIYLKYGFYLELLKSVTLKGSTGQERIREIVDNLRRENPVGWKLGNRTVTAILDFQNQTRNGKPSPADFGDLPQSNVIQLLLEPEGKLTIRPSGTEPKVKLYASLRYPEDPETLDELERARTALETELISVAGIFFVKAGLTN